MNIKIPPGESRGFVSAYHRWLLRQRLYCEHSGCMDRLNNATQVVNVNGQDLVYCQEHARRLADVRKSDKKQEITIQ